MGTFPQALKRGGDVSELDLNEAIAGAKQPGTDLVALDDAVKALEAIDPRKGQVVEMRFFGGLSVKGTAEKVLSPAFISNTASERNLGIPVKNQAVTLKRSTGEVVSEYFTAQR